MTDLFPSASGESPRLSWLRAHDLRVIEYQHPHSLNGNRRWVCCNRAQTRYVTADTEDAAEQRYCELFGLTWWKLADWNGAMEKIALPTPSELDIAQVCGISGDPFGVAVPPDDGWRF